MLNYLLKNDKFPDIENALKAPNGLLAISDDLSTERLLDAYKKGIFPWFNEGEPVLWFSPNPRMVIDKNSLKIAKSLKKLINTAKYQIKINSQFDTVIKNCATIKRDDDGTWINSKMIKAYTKLYHLGYAKSVEVYEDNNLIGGLYGVSMAKVFFGESMFYLKPNASKIALVHLVNNMDYELIDCQVETEHLKSLGAYNLVRKDFITKMQKLLI